MVLITSTLLSKATTKKATRQQQSFKSEGNEYEQTELTPSAEELRVASNQSRDIIDETFY